MPFIGNDVVDLAEANTGVGDHRQRFIARICTPEEQTLVEHSDHADLTLWAIWAAKETAFKIALRRDVDTAFIKHQFIVVDAPQANADHQGTVRFQDMLIQVQWTIRSDFVHCIGVLSEDDALLDDLTSAVCLEADASLAEIMLTKREQHSVRSDTSMKVRQLAKKLLNEHGLNDVEIIRKQEPERWRAPRLWRGDEELTQSGISLSHHGRFVAAAVWFPS